MNQIQIRVSEFATQQADAQVLLAPMMLLDDEVLKQVAGAGPYGGWSAALAATSGPYGGW